MKDKKDIKNLQDKTKSKTKENVKGDMLTTRLIRSFFKNHKVFHLKFKKSRGRER